MERAELCAKARYGKRHIYRGAELLKQHLKNPVNQLVLSGRNSLMLVLLEIQIQHSR